MMTTLSDALDRLLATLCTYDGEGAFNQYRDCDPELDLPNGAAIRRHNLRQYLEAFADARYVLVGEAPGYAGCRFSGIHFTCEAQIAGESPLWWARGRKLARSSRRERPWSEMSARIVWGVLDGRADCLLWAAFPWHPFGRRGPLSNRTPRRSEVQAALPVLKQFLALFPDARPYAVGRVAQYALAKLGIKAPYIRHPSHGGKREFAAGVAALGNLTNREEER